MKFDIKSRVYGNTIHGANFLKNKISKLLKKIKQAKEDIALREEHLPGLKRRHEQLDNNETYRLYFGTLEDLECLKTDLYNFELNLFLSKVQRDLERGKNFFYARDHRGKLIYIVKPHEDVDATFPPIEPIENHVSKITELGFGRSYNAGHYLAVLIIADPKKKRRHYRKNRRRRMETRDFIFSIKIFEVKFLDDILMTILMVLVVLLFEDHLFEFSPGRRNDMAYT